MYVLGAKYPMVTFCIVYFFTKDEPPYWITKWPPFEIYISDYLWV